MFTYPCRRCGCIFAISNISSSCVHVSVIYVSVIYVSVIYVVHVIVNSLANRVIYESLAKYMTITNGQTASFMGI